MMANSITNKKSYNNYQKLNIQFKFFIKKTIQ